MLHNVSGVVDHHCAIGGGGHSGEKLPDLIGKRRAAPPSQNLHYGIGHPSTRFPHARINATPIPKIGFSPPPPGPNLVITQGATRNMGAGTCRGHVHLAAHPQSTNYCGSSPSHPPISAQTLATFKSLRNHGRNSHDVCTEATPTEARKRGCTSQSKTLPPYKTCAIALRMDSFMWSHASGQIIWSGCVCGHYGCYVA